MSPRRRAPLRPTRAASVREVSGTRELTDPRELKRLSALMEESGLVELEIESGGQRVRLVRGRVETSTAVASTAPIEARSARRDPDAEGGPAAIASPMVGTFHRAANPETAPFVEIGDVVERGQVLGLIEAMKMMNELEAEFRGRIVAIVVENGQPVEYGEPLFLVEPL